MFVELFVGDKFGSLTLVESYSKKNRSWWKCDCVCGGNIETDSTRLRRGMIHRCKLCVAAEHLKNKLIRASKEYRAWSNMKTRCDNSSYYLFDRYGGRGISYCDSWIDFKCFISDMGYAPTKSHSLDRIDGDKGYDKDNCQWSTPKEQANNRIDNVHYEYKGESKTLALWCDQLDVKYDTVRARLESGNFTVEQAFELKAGGGHSKFIYITPKGEFKSIVQVYKDHVGRPQKIRKRFDDSDYPDWKMIPAY